MRSSEDSVAVPQEVVDAFTSAVLTTLQELIQVEVSNDPRDRPSTEVSLAEPIVSATVHLVRQVPGTMTLVLPADAAAFVAARYLPEATPMTHEIVDDVVGEFANVIAGQAKTLLKGTLFHFLMSPPWVARAPCLDALAFEAKNPIVSFAFGWGSLRVFVHLPPCPGA